MIKDKLTEIYNALKVMRHFLGFLSSRLNVLRRFPKRSQVLSSFRSAPPLQNDRGAIQVCQRLFLYQINVESTDRIKCKELQGAIEKIMESEGFYQTDGVWIHGSLKSNAMQMLGPIEERAGCVTIIRKEI